MAHHYVGPADGKNFLPQSEVVARLTEAFPIHVFDEEKGAADKKLPWTITWRVTNLHGFLSYKFRVVALFRYADGSVAFASQASGKVQGTEAVFPDRVFDRSEEMEIISLHLGDTLDQASRRR